MKNSKKLIEEYSHSGKGYNPYLIGPKWQVAQLNFMPELAPDAIKKIDVHHNTDETFLLMAGQAVLIAAKINNKELSFEVINLAPKKLYNIPKGCWHNIALSTDAEVLITEDANTHLGDYEFYYLNQEEQTELGLLIQSVWRK
ncbi:hypothetical protein [Arenibacter troitsensis]|uniref:Cupin fold metalloprotein, WbuC family n=1 Tax=Arenibacter troitsensis TaxID=188872 RepID=A0A1X7KJP5_9FLAO|nr:hypothetical protein [Arenibacter troitsensis]SMG41309.1 hypothetical protein SAMN03080602_02993 [Arenibacter troitsensis]